MRHLCTHCGYLGEPCSITKGHILFELFLWLLMILPGLIYSAWRHASRYQGCPKCAAAGMIPESSPVAQRFIKDLAPPAGG